jgi:uncharacterized membrane protein (DUF2068 family)
LNAEGSTKLDRAAKAKAFWRRMLGHAGVYYTIAGLSISVLFGMALAIDHYYTEETLFGMLELLGGMLMLAAGLYMLYGSLMWFREEGEWRSFESRLGAFFAKARAIPPAEFALVTVPYWLSRVALLLAMLLRSAGRSERDLLILIPLAAYCVASSAVFQYALQKKIFRNLVLLPFDFIVAWLIISVQF